MANETVKRLLARVRELRESRGLSQEAFAERAGLKYKHYQAIEAGRKMEFKISTLLKLAKACGLEPWELLNPAAMASAIGEGTQAKYDAGNDRRRSKGQSKR